MNNNYMYTFNVLNKVYNKEQLRREKIKYILLKIKVIKN